MYQSVASRGQPKAVPLEEALAITGYGRFHHVLSVVLGFLLLAIFTQILMMAYVIPALGCDIYLTPTQKGALSSISFAGMLVSSHFFGFLSDNFGRHNVMIKCASVTVLFCLGTSLAVDYISLAVAWFLNGFMIAGVVTPCYVYMCEFTPLFSRAKILLITASLASLSFTLDPCLAWLILPLKVEWELWDGMVVRSWRVMLAASALPTVLAVVFLAFLPESPKFLLCQGRKQECLVVLKRIHRVNRTGKVDSFPVAEVCLDDADMISVVSDNSTFAGFFKSAWCQTALLFSPPLLNYTLVSCALQFGIIGTYNTILLWFPEMVNRMSTHQATSPAYDVTLCELFTKDKAPSNPGLLENMADCSSDINTDVFVTNIAIGLVQVVAYTATSKVTGIIGRRSLIVTFMLIPSLCSFFLTVIRSALMTSVMVGIILVMVGCTLPVALSIVVDFFPTHVRSMATSICMIFGRLGATVGSQLFGYFQETHCDSVFYLITAFQIGIAILCTVLPIK